MLSDRELAQRRVACNAQREDGRSRRDEGIKIGAAGMLLREFGDRVGLAGDVVRLSCDCAVCLGFGAGAGGVESAKPRTREPFLFARIGAVEQPKPNLVFAEVVELLEANLSVGRGPHFSSVSPGADESSVIQ